MNTTPNRFAGPAHPDTLQFTSGDSSARRACLRLSVALAMVWAFGCDDGPKPPVACHDIPPQTTHVGLKTLVEPCFEDPEMGELTLAVTSSSPEVVTSEMFGDQVQIVGVSPGTAIITVTATDLDGLTGELSFEALVPNRAPKWPEDVEIPAFRLEVEGPAAQLVLSEYFVDPDGQQLSYDAESSDTEVVSVALSSDTLDVTGTDVGTAIVSVIATDGELDDTVRMEALVLRRPGPPTGLDAVLWNNSTDSVVVTWTPPADTGGTAITGYRVEHWHQTIDRWRNVRNTDTTLARFIISDRGLNGYNHFRVSAVNEVGAGDPSNVDSVYITIPWVPEPPRLTAWLNTTTGPTGRKRRNVVLQWQPSPNEVDTIGRWQWRVDRAKIDGSRDSGEWEVYLSSLEKKERSTHWAWSTFVDSIRFRVAIRYVDENDEPRGIGTWSNVVRAAWGGPNQPTDLTATAEGDSTVVLSWTAAEDTLLWMAPGTGVKGYMIETSSDGGITWDYLVSNTGSTATTYRHEGLAGGTYLYVVSAINDVGVGPPSNVTEITLGAATSMRQWSILRR